MASRGFLVEFCRLGKRRGDEDEDEDGDVVENWSRAESDPRMISLSQITWTGLIRMLLFLSGSSNTVH